MGCCEASLSTHFERPQVFCQLDMVTNQIHIGHIIESDRLHKSLHVRIIYMPSHKECWWVLQNLISLSLFVSLVLWYAQELLIFKGQWLI